MSEAFAILDESEAKPPECTFEIKLLVVVDEVELQSTKVLESEVRRKDLEHASFEALPDVILIWDGKVNKKFLECVAATEQPELARDVLFEWLVWEMKHKPF